MSRSDIEYFDSWNAGGNVPDFRRLQCFAEVARMRSITRAATALHIEQPALSRQIKLLEQEIGVRLFHRNGRGVELTEQGANVLTRVSRLLQEVESAEQDIKAMKAAPLTAVRLGVQPSLSHALLAPVIQRLRHVAPEVVLRVVEATSIQLVESLQSRQIDLALAYALPLETDQVTCLQEDEVCLVGPPEDPELTRGPVTLRRLAGLRLILPSRGLLVREFVENAFADVGVPLCVDMEVDAIGPIIELAAAGRGYSLLPYMLVHREVEAGQLGLAVLEGPAPKLPLVLARASCGTLRAPERLVMDVVTTEARAIRRIGARKASPNK